MLPCDLHPSSHPAEFSLHSTHSRTPTSTSTNHPRNQDGPRQVTPTAATPHSSHITHPSCFLTTIQQQDKPTQQQLHPTHHQGQDDDPNQTDRLPTYHELQEKEGHRFGRWKGWIEKRARERMEERAIDRQTAELQGLAFGTGWDLPQHQPHPETHPHSLPNTINRNSSIISSRDERAAFRSATRNHRDVFSKHDKGRSDASSNHRFNLESAPGAVNLTPSTSIQPIGSRFLPQFPSQPLCAIPLSLAQSPSTTQPPVERFLLVGTIDGLYVCDLIPSLSSTVKTDSVSSTDSKIYQIWQGLGIHQLEIAIEDPLHCSKYSTAAPGSRLTALPGIVIALTSSSQESSASGSLDGITKLIKMWPLQSIINLVKFRAFSEHSECLDLTEESPVSRRDSTLTIGTSALAGLKSMFEKGKHKAESSISSIADMRQATFPPANTSNRSSFSAQAPSIGPTPKHKSSNPPHLELPLQWAKQTISLNLPRIQANGPILFIKLSNSPTQGFNPINDQFDQTFDSSSIPKALRPRSYAAPDDTDHLPPSAASPNDGWWYLIIATKQLIFIMESQPAPQRTWHLCAEMSAPFTAKTANLVLSEFPKSNPSRVPSSSRSLPYSRRPNNHRPGSGELSVLLTMKEYAVVISLSDLSVRELDLQGALATSQTTTSLSSYGPTLKPTSGSFSGLDHLDRIQNNFIPFARNLPSIGGSVEPILTKKKVKDLNEGFQVENRRSTNSVRDRRWAGCEELLIPVPIRTSRLDPQQPTMNQDGNHNLRVIYLITRGYFTHAVMCPFGYKPRSRSSQRNSFNPSVDPSAGVTACGIPPPLLLKPFHTFTWRAIPIKVHARIIPTPSKWEKRSAAAKKQNNRKSSSYPLPSSTHDHHDKEESENNHEDQDEEEEVFCCLTAFTASSIEVQEGFISLTFLRSMWEQVGKNKIKDTHDSFSSFFTPASYRSRRHRFRTSTCSTFSTRSSMGSSETHSEDQQSPFTSGSSSFQKSPRPPISTFPSSSSSSSSSEKEEDDSNDQSSYDYSAKIGYLCSSANWFPPPPLPSPASSSSQDKPHHHQLDRNPDSFDSTITLHPNHLNLNLNPPSSSDPLRPPDHHLQHTSNPLIHHHHSVQGSFFWKQAVGEWKIMYVCNTMHVV